MFIDFLKDQDSGEDTPSIVPPSVMEEERALPVVLVTKLQKKKKFLTFAQRQKLAAKQTKTLTACDICGKVSSRVVSTGVLSFP